MGFFSRLFGGSGGSTPAAKPASAPPAKKPERIESSADAAWRAKIQEGLSHAKNKDWGLYTNARLDLGQMAMKERRHRMWIGYSNASF